jgi:hypothetical protein
MLPNVSPTLRWKIEQMIAIHIVELIPEVGVHHHTVDPQTCMGVKVTILQYFEFLIAILYTP